MKKISTHAAAAKAIRQELKKAFPLTAFSVRSRSFAGGDAIDVEWTNGPTDKVVSEIVSKYEYGHFNSMEDIYEYSNKRNDVPQVKYVQTRREVSEDIKQQVFENLQKTHAYFDEVKSIHESSQTLLNHWSAWTASEYVYRILVKIDLTNGYKEYLEYATNS